MKIERISKKKGVFTKPCKRQVLGDAERKRIPVLNPIKK